MGITENKFRVLGDSNLYGNTRCSSYDSNVLMVDTSGKGIYIGNNSSNPTLIADNGEGKYLKISDYLDNYHTPQYNTGLMIGEGAGVDDLYVPYCSSTQDGIVPMADGSDGIINSSTGDLVLSYDSSNKTIGWYKLPLNAFANTITPYFCFVSSTPANNSPKLCTGSYYVPSGSSIATGSLIYVKFVNGNSVEFSQIQITANGSTSIYAVYYKEAFLTLADSTWSPGTIVCFICTARNRLDVVGVLGGTGGTGTNTYLPLSGGKITGDGKVYFNYDDALLKDTSSNFIQGNNISSLKINAGSTILFGINGNSKLVLSSNSISPFEGNDFSIGVDDYRFAYGYFNNSVYAAEGFYESSDERLKDFYNNVEVDLDKLAQLPKKYFTWKKDNDKDVKPLHIGTSAQELKKLYPELVTTTNDGHLNVAYDKLSIIALKGIDVLNDKIKSLEDRIVSIEKNINI